MYLFSYFKTNDEAMYLAFSEDGYAWSKMNEGRAALRSKVGTKRLRDPFLLQDSGGVFHALWTDGWESSSIGYARSVDLLHWDNQKLLPVMASVAGTLNCWAPEAFRDADSGTYRIIWSSTISGEAGDTRRNHRIWSASTTDFSELSAPALYFDPGHTIIDATIAELQEQYVMLFKDERGSNEPGTDNKAIRSLVWDKRLGSVPPVAVEPSELLTPPLTEGPSLYRTASEWILLYDGFSEGTYRGMSSDDLVHWRSASYRLKLPDGCRHGSVMKADAMAIALPR
ncbi:glycoside hydrolase family 43 protein [Paenibacillus sp. HB172176]|uniref:glycoside hydrolase family 43 protein n=1 Tax=Paenibacillus sp. HB172176 TaxID=2493690 RepID=UPI001439ACE1|nr:glycoside hydrolase family 43 protein [Paenibacillus sp. HB172176]